MKTKIAALAVLTTLAPLVAPSADQSTASRKSPSDYPVYRLSPGDRVSITMVGHPELRIAGVLIDADGYVRGEMLATGFKLSGLSVAEAESLLEAHYRRQGVSEPHCSILIDSYAPRKRA